MSFEDGDSVVHVQSGRIGEVVSVRPGRVPMVEVAWTDDGEIQRLPIDLLRKDDRLVYQAPASTRKRPKASISKQQWRNQRTPKRRQNVSSGLTPLRETTAEMRDLFAGETPPSQRTPEQWYALIPKLAHWAFKKRNR